MAAPGAEPWHELLFLTCAYDCVFCGHSLFFVWDWKGVGGSCTVEAQRRFHRYSASRRGCILSQRTSGKVDLARPSQVHSHLPPSVYPGELRAWRRSWQPHGKIKRCDGQVKSSPREQRKHGGSRWRQRECWRAECRKRGNRHCNRRCRHAGLFEAS